jgi:hypothetical protein
MFLPFAANCDGRVLSRILNLLFRPVPGKNA